MPSRLKVPGSSRLPVSWSARLDVASSGCGEVKVIAGGVKSSTMSNETWAGTEARPAKSAIVAERAWNPSASGPVGVRTSSLGRSSS